MPAENVQLDYTGERIIAGVTPEITFREHQMRYVFAAQFVAGLRVLDIASGSGVGTDYLLRAGAASCFGLDLSPSALRYARYRYRLHHLAACDATRLCLADQSLDVIVSFETIEHLAEPRHFLLECERVLRPGGRFICSTPNREVTRWDQENPFHVTEMPVHEFYRQVSGIFADSTLYGQAPVPYPFYAAKKKIAGTLDRLHLKEWVKRRLRVKADHVCSDADFTDGKRYARYAVTRDLPPWPSKPRYAIVVARKYPGESNGIEKVMG
jgi:SAM-dependent methyltransferase